MEDDTKVKIERILLLLIGLIVFYVCFWHAEITEGYKLDNWECTNSTLDNFESCIDIGVESAGFLSANHYYLCDKHKIVYDCFKGSYQTKTKVNLTVSDILFSYPKVELLQAK